MNIRYVAEFVALAETCNFSIAADQMFISQSSISKHIKQLENELGVSLLDRSTRSVVLSRAGEAFLPYAKEFTRTWSNMLATMDQFNSEKKLTLTIGAMNPIKWYNIPSFINQFYLAHPSCSITTKNISASGFREALLNGTLSFAFVQQYLLDKSDDLLEAIPFAYDRLNVMLPAAHPLADHKKISLTELKDEPYIGVPVGSPIYKRNAVAFQCADFKPNTVLSIEFHEAQVDCVKQGLGYGLTLQRPIENFIDPDIRFLELDPLIPINIMLVFQRGKHFSKIEKEFMSAAEAFSTV